MADRNASITVLAGDDKYFPPHLSALLSLMLIKIMYCLPYPQDSDGIVAPVEVPYVAKFDYDISIPGNFKNFPKQCGFESWDRPPEDLASLMQSWLYFGLISEVLGQSVEPTSFVHVRRGFDGEVRYIDPKLKYQLHALFSDRCQSLYQKDEAQANFIWSKIRESITFAEEQTLGFEKIEAPPDSTLACVALSVQLLLSWLKIQFNVLRRGQRSRDDHIAGSSTLEQAFDQEYFEPFESNNQMLAHYKLNLSQRNPIEPSDSTPLSTQILISRMKSQGWCPQRIKIVCSSFSYPTVYYMSSLYRRAPSHLTHEHCSQAGCVANDYLTGPMLPSHRTKDCICLDVGPLMDSVKEIINRGEVPLIRVRQMQSGQIELQVVKCASHTRYVAISHVWSDRQLGSQQNNLPQCQLEDIDQLISRLPKNIGRGMWAFDTLCALMSQLLWRIGIIKYPTSGDRLFWLDTLCIPSPGKVQDDDPEHTRLRMKAINMMDLIYAGASQVLVLDSELRQIRGGNQQVRTVGEGLLHQCFVNLEVPERRRLNEVLAHVLCCNWMGRAWTLQEGVLARDCILQLADSIIKIDHMNYRHYLPHYQRTLRVKLPPKSEKCTGSNILVTFNWWWTIAVSSFQEPINSGHLSRLRRCLKALFCVMLSIFAIISSPFHYLILSMEIRVWANTFGKYRPRTMGEHFSDELHGGILTSLNPNIVDFDRTNLSENFKTVWNALIERSTKEPQDLHTVLANLLGFNAGYMVGNKQDPGERMKAILFSLDQLPISLLYINTPKYRKRRDAQPDSGKNRWIPLAPSHERLDRATSMTFTEEGFLLDANYNHSTLVCVLGPGTPRSQRFRLPSIAKTSSESEVEQVYWIEALLPAEDDLPETPEGASYIILENEARNHIRGARLLVSRVDGEKIFLRYDCALRGKLSSSAPGILTNSDIQDSQQLSSNIIPLYLARNPPIDAMLFMEHGKLFYPPPSYTTQSVTNSLCRHRQPKTTLPPPPPKHNAHHASLHNHHLQASRLLWLHPELGDSRPGDYISEQLL
jgi:hypothetical protein